MSLLQQIRTDLDTARKAKNQSLLTTLITVYSEAGMVGKNKRNAESTDDEVLSVLRKFKEGVLEIDKITGTTSVTELAIYDKYIPTLMSTEALTVIIQDIVNLLPEKTPKQMGIVMGKLKAGYANLYDGSVASQLTKELLS